MRNMLLAIIGVALVVIVASFVKKSNQDYHYVLLQQDGSIVAGTNPLRFEDLEWRNDSGAGDIFIPLLNGCPVLCKIGDEKGAMYTYHPFSASNRKDFKHNPTTISPSELKYCLKGFSRINFDQSDKYQLVVKIKRDLGGVDSVERGLIEGSLSLRGR